MCESFNTCKHVSLGCDMNEFEACMSPYLQLATLTTSTLSPAVPLCSVDDSSAGCPPARRKANIGLPSAKKGPGQLLRSRASLSSQLKYVQNEEGCDLSATVTPRRSACSLEKTKNATKAAATATPTISRMIWRMVCLHAIWTRSVPWTGAVDSHSILNLPLLLLSK